MNTAIGLFKFLIIIFILYILTIYFICLVRKCDVKTAMRSFWTFVLECFDINTGNDSSMVDFPVYMGIDERGFPHANNIDNCFADLANDFGVFHFYDMGFDENCLMYQFRADMPKKQMSEFDMLQYTRKKCEAIVHRFMHSQNPSLGHINSLVSTSYNDDILCVYIARNAKGVEKIAERNRALYHLYKSKNTVTQKTLNEVWDDDDEMGL